MPPEQRDYGNSEPTLVPGALTVFRHFQADLRSGVLTPMNYNPKWAARNGAPPSPGHRAYSRPMSNLTVGWLSGGEPPELEQPTYQAECNKLYQIHFDHFYNVSHKSPKKDCTCGFYASYDPETDFYPSFRWGRAYARLAGAEDYVDFAVVKAAVEVSGTVVMGRLGVRAEKMKILGIALDWDKKVSERDAAETLGSWARDPYYFDMGVQSQRRYVAYNPTTGEYEMRQVEVEEDDDAQTIAQTHNLANYYGATYHGSVADLVKAYPKADVSALGIDEAPPEAEPDTWGGFRMRLQGPNPALMQQQALYAQKAIQQAGNSFKEMAKVLSDVWGVDVFSATPKQKKWRPGGTMPDHARRALEAKQNRKPPPGSGIDRRKRKL